MCSAGFKKNSAKLCTGEPGFATVWHVKCCIIRYIYIIVLYHVFVFKKNSISILPLLLLLYIFLFMFNISSFLLFIFHSYYIFYHLYLLFFISILSFLFPCIFQHLYSLFYICIYRVRMTIISPFYFYSILVYIFIFSLCSICSQWKSNSYRSFAP